MAPEFRHQQYLAKVPNGHARHANTGGSFPHNRVDFATRRFVE